MVIEPNINTSGVRRAGKINKSRIYTMNGRDHGNTEEQRALAYTFNTLKVSPKTDKVEKAADGILAFVT